MSTGRAITRPPALHWLVMLAGLIAMTGLYFTEEGSVTLVLIALALPASRLVRFRLATSGQVYGAILGLLALVIAGSVTHPEFTGQGLGDPRQSALIGETFAAALLLVAWMDTPLQQASAPATAMVSGMVMLCGCNTLNVFPIRFLAPAYFICIALGLRTMKSVGEPDVVDRGGAVVALARAVLVAAAIAIGGLSYGAFFTYREVLTEWGMRLLREMPTPPNRSALSNRPHLGSGAGRDGGLDRVMRLEGLPEPMHLRAVSFSDYSEGSWGPDRSSRPVLTVAPTTLIAGADRTKPGVRVLPLIANDGLLCAPLAALGIDPDGNPCTWCRAEGGPLQTGLASPVPYRFWLGDQYTQGPLCGAPSQAERRRLLVVPAAIDPRVRQLAERITAKADSTPARMAAIVEHLMTTHQYSLDYRPGLGDQVSGFILSRRPAHCEYFGSAAVILMRCVGIPARYVIGFYAHEGAGEPITEVRARDAHAWAEAYVDGVGWVTVDATPSAGMPDAAGGPPIWQRLKEWWQDHREDLALTPRRRLIGGAALGLLAILRALYLLFKRRQARLAAEGPRFEYRPAPPDLDALASRFLRLCSRIGRPCPPNSTWAEHVAAMEPVAGLDRSALARFVEGYNAERFGAGGQDLALLAAALAAAEAEVGQATGPRA